MIIPRYIIITSRFLVNFRSGYPSHRRRGDDEDFPCRLQRPGWAGEWGLRDGGVYRVSVDAGEGGEGVAAGRGAHSRAHKAHKAHRDFLAPQLSLATVSLYFYCVLIGLRADCAACAAPPASPLRREGSPPAGFACSGRTHGHDESHDHRVTRRHASPRVATRRHAAGTELKPASLATRSHSQCHRATTPRRPAYGANRRGTYSDPRTSPLMPPPPTCTAPPSPAPSSKRWITSLAPTSGSPTPRHAPLGRAGSAWQRGARAVSNSA